MLRQKGWNLFKDRSDSGAVLPVRFADIVGIESQNVTILSIRRCKASVSLEIFHYALWHSAYQHILLMDTVLSESSIRCSPLIHNIDNREFGTIREYEIA